MKNMVATASVEVPGVSIKLLVTLTIAMVLAGPAITIGDQQASSYVASVKRTAPSVDRMSVAFPGLDTFRATAATVQFLMEFAYELKHFERTPGLPDWAARERFDISAKAERPVKTMAERRALVRQVLADEFGLLTHTDTRPVDVLALQRAQPGNALPEGVEPATGCVPRGYPPENGKPPCRLGAGPTLFTSTGASMADLSAALSALLKERVIDETGLEGQYRFTLRFASVIGHAPIDAKDDAPDLTTAVREQLGLVLVRARLPMPVVVADRVNRPHLD
jgi:uncharacterized protein (TIGR03435 family)